MFYAAKLASIYLYARKDQIAAMVAALRAEERAALTVLHERQAVKFRERRRRYAAPRRRIYIQPGPRGPKRPRPKYLPGDRKPLEP